MHRTVLLIFVLVMACSNPALESQQIQVINATTTLHEERARLQTMRDSLQSEIQRTIALGIPREQAENLERARIKAQETLVIAAEKNLTAQKTLLDSLAKYDP